MMPDEDEERVFDEEGIGPLLANLDLSLILGSGPDAPCPDGCHCFCAPAAAIEPIDDGEVGRVWECCNCIATTVWRVRK